MIGICKLLYCFFIKFFHSVLKFYRTLEQITHTGDQLAVVGYQRLSTCI